jgi:hypothetical protein
MLRSLRGFERYAVGATDGDMGSVENFLVDDQSWVVRYLVVETGGLLGGRRVLISPISFRQTEAASCRFELALTMNKIENSPSIDLDKPVSRQHERDYHQYYGYPYYWGYGGLWGTGTYPGILATNAPEDVYAGQRDDAPGDAHLRSAREVCGYHVQGSDGAIGHVEDFIVDDETWEVRYLVIDTSNWWFGKRVLVAPCWASRVSWDERKIFVDMSRAAIKNSPEWDGTAGINRVYEARLYDYYGHPAYWATATRPGAPPAHPIHPAW